MPDKPADRGVFDINASIRIIRHISGGIYRNPGNAMKELVINAFDAGARHVNIDLGGPADVSQIVISDDGEGLTEEDMHFSFTHVGASLKKLQHAENPAPPRPIVGQFGVGMLAAAHASTKMEIESTPRDLAENYTLLVHIDLSPFFEYERQVETLEEYTYGTVKWETIPKGGRKPGTKVTLVRNREKPEAKRFWEALNRSGAEFAVFNETESRKGTEPFEQFVKWIDNDFTGATISDMRGYEQFLWQLGLILPVQYVTDGPIRKEFLGKLGDDKSADELRRNVDQMKKELQAYDFHVIVDGVELLKPIILPSNLDNEKMREKLSYGEWNALPITYKTQQTRAVGYVFFQPYRIRPMELRGIYSRLKGVGVGQYDNTLFKVVRHLPVVSYQISGELNLQAGFDEALNLDRTGFIETDGAYIDLVDYLTRRLEKDDHSILNQIMETKNARAGRQDRDKTNKALRAIKEASKLAYPEYSVKALAQAVMEEMGEGDSDYALVRISHSSKTIAVDWSVLGNPDLLRVILALEKALAAKGVAKALAEQIRESVRSALVEQILS